GPGDVRRRARADRGRELLAVAGVGHDLVVARAAGVGRHELLAHVPCVLLAGGALPLCPVRRDDAPRVDPPGQLDLRLRHGEWGEEKQPGEQLEDRPSHLAPPVGYWSRSVTIPVRYQTRTGTPPGTFTRST